MISNNMIQAGKDTLAPLLKTFFNQITKSEIFPDKWGDGFLVPIFKSGDVNDTSNYRGISITSCLGKLFTYLINNRLQFFF